ncbi:MAG: CTP synthase [Chloroflexi bacterium]|nr:CTP synthase [Chloroflexota bacterium]
MSSDEPSPKYIFITGGVISSVGKGITTASLGRLLQSRGLSVTVQKLDPYLNVDPGTMSPYQHGEVYVTDDGAETDLDLGHYERFLDQNLTSASSVTMGQISAELIERERRGDYLGGTIQTVPHVTDLVKERVRGLALKAGVDVLIVEVGGTVGDIEGQAFLEAIRQMRYEEPRNGTLAIHVTPLFHLKATDELKTKPTQHSVRTLRSMGIQPDVIISRTDIPAEASITDKLALFCDVPAEAVMTLETASSIYQVPSMLERAGLTDLTLDRLGLEPKPCVSDRSINAWTDWTDRLGQTERVCRVAIVGKYVELRDAYLSVKEALIHAGAQRRASVDITWIQSDDLDEADQPEIAAALADVDGVIVPGGFGERGIEGEVGVARFALQQRIPYLGLCRGMQNMVIAFARERLDLPDANTTEADEDTDAPVIALLDEQREVSEKGGTMRLGMYTCQLHPETRARQLYEAGIAHERHRHRWEFNPEYRDRFERAGLVASGTSRDGALVEIAEVHGHPFMLGSQFHPELKSRPERSHPLFVGFIDSVLSEAETALRHPAGATNRSTSTLPHAGGSAEGPQT